MTVRFRFILAAVLSAVSLCAFVVAAETPVVRPFTADSLAAIKQAQKKKPFILAFWSLHCAPCKEDIALLKVVHAKHPELTIVLVAADSPRESADVARYLAQLGLGRIQAWVFADEFEERVRYSIDPEWRGELPRSYLYAPDHTATAHSGVLDIKVVEAWLAQVLKRP